MNEKKKEKRKLLIIGNGFDLQCELRSSFSHFFEDKSLSDCKNKYEFLLKQRGSIEIFNSTNFWTLWLFFKYYEPIIDGSRTHLILKDNIGEIKWMDVEQSIKDVFVVVIKNRETLFDILCYQHEPNHIPRPLGDYINLLYRLFHKSTEKELLDFLFSQLTEFECLFIKHMEEITKGNDVYEAKKKALFQKLTRGYKYISVLNFNYTTVGDINGKIVEEENVLGSLKRKNIIIGIDTNEFPDNPAFFSFTKAYRKLSLYFSQPNKDNQVINVFNKHFDSIEFYGHSLGEQDYTYFKTIFSYYERNDANHKYTFKYSDYNGRKVNEQKKDIYFLFEKYQKDFLFTLINLKRFNVKTIL